MGWRIRLVFALFAGALATAPLVTAGDGKEQIRLNPADQAAARAVVMRRADLGSNAKLISFGKVPFPHLSAYSARFRAVVSVQAFGREARLVTDIVFVLHGRTEITLNVAGPASAKRALSAAETRLARVLVSRARA